MLPESTLLTLADTCLISGHRLSEWCGHGPALEEDIALTNTALDAIGQARALLQVVAARRSPAITEDALAYLREPAQFANLALAAAPNTDYAHTVLRSLLLAAWLVPVWDALGHSSDHDIAAIAGNAAKEARVQRRHARQWWVRFGDGTAESRRRAEAAVAALWPLTGELSAVRIPGVDPDAVLSAWWDAVQDAFAEATMPLPTAAPPLSGELAAQAAQWRHALLGEMQSLARQHPGARW